MISAAFRDAILWQAATCEGMGAPFTAAVLSACVEPEAAAALSPLLQPYEGPSAKALVIGAFPLRILAGLHFLVLSGAAPGLAALYAAETPDGLGGEVAAAARAHPAVLARFLTSPPQTNEVRRSLALVGGFLTVAQETGLSLRCLELGASAGLNMNWDRYAYDFGARRRWGEPAAPLTLSGDWTGGPPPLDARVEVVEKRACDQAPIDVRSEQGALRLQAYIWPEQHERLDRIRAAIAIARETDLVVEAADAADWTAACADPTQGVSTIVYHSIFLQYPPPEAQAAILAAIAAKGAAATADALFAWLRMEPKPENPIEVEVRLTIWPTGKDVRLAEAHSHGAAVNWLA